MRLTGCEGGLESFREGRGKEGCRKAEHVDARLMMPSKIGCCMLTTTSETFPGSSGQARSADLLEGSVERCKLSRSHNIGSEHPR
eukprot:759904-Hanusia_phi.AAC.2